MKYDVDYFIRKFQAIPEHLWCIRFFYTKTNEVYQRCAYGHCGINKGEDFQNNEEANALSTIIDVCSVYDINDGKDEKYQQPTPKQRILAALHDIKKMQEPVKIEPKTVTKYVAVPVSLNEETKKLILS